MAAMAVAMSSGRYSNAPNGHAADTWSLPAIAQAVFGPWVCSGFIPQDTSCCKSEDATEELLTSAWIERLDQVSAFGDREKALLVPMDASPPEAGSSTPSHGQRTGAAQTGHDRSERSARSQDKPQESENTAAVPPSVPTSPAGLGKLQVPLEFDDARSGLLSAAGCPSTPNSHTSSSSPSSQCHAAVEEQRRCLQFSLRAFTRSMLRGISVNVLLDDGRTRLAEARLNTELSHLVLHVPNAQHPVALKCIETICIGEAQDQSPTRGQGLNDRCATLIIQGGQFLTFVFDTARIREYFEMSLKVIILAGEARSRTLAPAAHAAAAPPCGVLGAAEAGSHPNSSRGSCSGSPTSGTVKIASPAGSPRSSAGSAGMANSPLHQSPSGSPGAASCRENLAES